LAQLKRLSFFDKKDTDMTTGSIVRHLAVFSLPLLVGNVFQQLYNTVDAWVVGNFVSNEAFSAVGTVNPIINVLIGFFLGLSAGAGVVISQFYGGGRHEKVNRVVHTAMTLTLIFCFVFTLTGMLATPFMLRLMKTPEEVFPESQAYLTIYFAGVSGLMIYNMGASVLRAVGDSFRPFVFLVVSAVINTVLDLVFVICFDMGVRGVAWATIIAQGISALLVFISLMRTKTCIHFSFKRLNLDGEMLRFVFRLGMPAAIQMAITSFSNVFVQSYINYFGADMMSGWTVYMKIDAFLFMPMQSISIGVTTLVGQNLGKNQEERARYGTTVGFRMSFIVTLIILIPVLVFAPQLTAFFNDKPEVITNGTMILRWLSPFYLTCCVNQLYSSSLRGAGDTYRSTAMMLFSYVLFRQIYLYIMANYVSNTIIPIILGYPAGWIICSTIIYIYYKKADMTKLRLKV